MNEKQSDYNGYGTCPGCGFMQWVGKPNGWVKGMSIQALCYGCGMTYDAVNKFFYEPQTQKAKGIYLLKNLINHWSDGVQAASPISCFPVKENLPLTALPSKNPVFARPCPPNPEHGFVESRVVKSIADLESLRKETLAVCPEAEIVLMNLIDAKLNMIWTPSMLTVGPGHDGATSGKNTISLPLVGMNSAISPDIMNKAGIKPEADPYVEAVVEIAKYSNDQVYITQLRGGPKLKSASPDFIPSPITVTEVIKTSGEDLLEWAKKIRTLKDAPPGTIIWHPGGSLCDHYSVHCRENNIPIALTFEPQVGSVLTPQPLPPPDPEAMKLGVVAGSLWGSEKSWTEGTALLLTCLHNSSSLRGPASFWLGAAASLMIKLGSGALRGEARHAHNAKSKVKTDLYSFYIPRSISFHRAAISRVTQILTYGFGDPTTSKSYGGKKWGLCGAALVPVFNAIRDLFLDPNPESAGAVTSALNIAVNQAHNGGWWLNKFISVSAYEQIPTGNFRWHLRAAKALYELGQLRSKAESVLPMFTKRVQSWPETQIQPLRWRRAALDVVPGSIVLTLKAATIPSTTQITIPVTENIVKSLIKQVGKVEIDQSSIKLIPPGKPEGVTIWKEIELIPDAEHV